MRGILALALIVIATISGGTVAYVYREATLDHDRAVDRCLDAGGGWLPRSARSFGGTCLAHPGEARPVSDPAGTVPR